MQHVSQTPFGQRPVTAALLAAQATARKAPALPRIDKWTVYQDLRTARARFGVTDRDLGVLYALLTFLPAKELAAEAALVVHPSNNSLCERAHGMAESTLRRHLAALVGAGLIVRQDSPNGKRYTLRDAGGGVAQAFGFDLRPLLVRAPEIAEAAAEVSEAARTLDRTRTALVLRLRDAAKLVAHYAEEGVPGNWQAAESPLAVARLGLRRTPTAASLAEVERAVALVEAMLPRDAPEETGAYAAHSGRHCLNQTTDSPDSELCHEDGKAEPLAPNLPLHLVLKACPDMVPYARHGIAGWHDLMEVAARVRPMLGISPSAWAEAERTMGRVNAAIAVAVILQRADTIRNPGGYLRHLSAKAAEGAFSPGPMVMATLVTPSSRAA